MEEQLKQYIEESRKLIIEHRLLADENRSLLTKIRKLINSGMAIAAVVFIPFLYSFIDIRVRVADIEGDYIPKDEMYTVFIQKVDALSVHMMEDDWTRTQFYKVTKDDYYLNDNSTRNLIKAFFQETHRSAD
jgi:hypothetical protein